MDCCSRKTVLLEEPLFPREVVTEILAMLPVKYLLRSRSVCKTWRNIIDHPQFTSKHLARATQLDSQENSTFIFMPCDYGSQELYHVEQLHEQEYSTSSCVFKATKIELTCPAASEQSSIPISPRICVNGLLSLSPYRWNYGDKYIYNIATRNYVKLPVVTSKPTMARIVSGFGFDSSSEAYKMVHIFHWGKVEAQVFTLGSHSWRRLESVPNAALNPINSSLSVSVNGSLHWFTESGHILTFDLRSEKFGEIPYPKGEINSSEFQVLNLGGCLSIYHSYKRHTELWTMKDYNVKESWTKLTIKNTHSEDSLRPICLWKNGDILLLSNSRDFVSYNVESERFTPLQIDGIPRACYEVHPYVGTLRHLQQLAEEKGNHEQTTATRISI